MKVLFVNPHVGPDHLVVKGLQAKGLAVLVAVNAQEAWQMLSLHGSNLDLAVIHREDAVDKDNEGGFKLIAKLKAAAQYADLPLVVTSHRWKDAEFAKHQDTPQGANAYLKWPNEAAAFYTLFEAVFGGVLPPSDASRSSIKDNAGEQDGGATRVDLSLKSPPSKPPSSPPSKMPSKPPLPTAPPKGGRTASGELVLEDASNLFSRNDHQEKSDTSIRLEMPEFESSSLVTMPAPTPEAAPPPAETKVEVEVPSSIGIDLEPAVGEPAIEFGGKKDIPIAENSGLSLLQPAGNASDALSAVLAQDAGIEGMLDAPAGTTVGLGGESDGLTTVQGFVPPPRPASLNPAPRQSQRQVEKPAPELEVSDADAAQDMPYLFQGGQGGQSTPAQAAAPGLSAFARPLGDAVVPGGAARAPDVDTLKKYLLLREQDVAVLSSQLKSAKDQVKAIDEQLRMERGRNSELGHVTSEQRRKLSEFEKEKQQALDNMQAEVTEIRFQLKAKTDKARILDSQVREAVEETERLKERVRADIRKIRVREKELENRLEIMKKDSEALIAARENKIIELKRKLDLLEFNMDLLQDQHAREKETSVKLRERLAKAAQVVRVAGGLLDTPSGAASQLAAALASDDPKSDEAA